MLTAFAVALTFAAGAMAGPGLQPRPGAPVKPVRTMPGWEGELPVKTFSAFVETPATAPANTTMRMHYQISECEKGFANCPVLVWWNGGPGAPSSWGLYIENGPFLLNEESYILPGYNATGIPQLVRNPYAWTKFATVLAFANPPPSGFSYCDPPGPAGEGASCGTWSDQRVGLTNAEALLAVFTQHFALLPEQDLFFVGESYAGVYISTTTEVLTTTERYSTVAAHLAGVALGDACMGFDAICGGHNGVYDWLFFFYGHGQLPTDFWHTLTAGCGVEELKHTPRGKLPKTCAALVDKALRMVGGYYTYNLYDDCPNNMFAVRGAATAQRRTVQHRAVAEQEHLRHVAAQRSGPGGMAFRAPAAHFNGYWCPGRVFEDYMNRSDVRAALGVPQDSLFFIADDARGMPYRFTVKDAFPFWGRLLRFAHGDTSAGRFFTKKPVRLMGYNGDADPAVNMFETEGVWYSFARNSSFAKSAEWRAWDANPAASVVGGYITQWLDGALSYATVRGSGHMVPEYRPMAAMALIGAFVRGGAPSAPAAYP